ncbi:hypothetical protein MHYP_G00165210 [Metynnis hypsauchen]
MEEEKNAERDCELCSRRKGLGIIALCMLQDTREKEQESSPGSSLGLRLLPHHPTDSRLFQGLKPQVKRCAFLWESTASLL